MGKRSGGIAERLASLSKQRRYTAVVRGGKRSVFLKRNPFGIEVQIHPRPCPPGGMCP